MSILERWSPVTHDLGLVEAPLDRVAEAYLAWRRRLGDELTTLQPSGLAGALAALVPLSAERRRVVLVPTRAPWTAYFAGGIDGSDPVPAMIELAGDLEVRAMRVCVTPPAAVHAGCVWEVFAPPSQGGEPPLGYLRSISAVQDGARWTFSQSGVPFAFEQTEAYQRRRKRERFTAALLSSYLERLGLSPFDDDFYAPPSAPAPLLVERKGRWRAPAKEWSLEEVLAGLPRAR